ncbi:MAG: methylmalonyl-CoA mutase small subunit [Pirellulales bacterium]|nr:methylmalonyl-CoA mutase small subunit [Pirellulales bacterium]
MLSEELTLDEFPPVDYAAWRALVDVDLAGAPFEKKLVTGAYEGIAIQPLYTAADWPSERAAMRGEPGTAPFVRGSRSTSESVAGWRLWQEHAHPDLGSTQQAIRDDVAGGVDGVLLRLDCAARSGIDPNDAAAMDLAARDGVAAYSLDDFDAVLAGVDLAKVAVALEAGAAFVPAAALMVQLWQRRSVGLDRAVGAFNADPLAVLARDGALPLAIDEALALLSDLAVWTEAHAPHVTAVRVGTAPYHHAGATAAQDLGFALATGVEYLRAMTAAGLAVDAAALQLVFNMAVGTHHFLAISKLRAARRLWSRVVEASGGSPTAGAMQLHAKTSKRVLTTRDPHVNLLRNTAAVFAAALGGAETITSVPFDAPLGLPDLHSRRVARNTAIILKEEGHLHRVADAPGGSWYLERLTDELAEKGWGVFQQVEAQGGMRAALESGWIAAQIESAFAPRAKKLADRREGIVGVSEFADAKHVRLERPAPDRAAIARTAAERIASIRREQALEVGSLVSGTKPGERTVGAIAAAAAGATIGSLAGALGFGGASPSIAPLALSPFAQPFEELRDACDAWAVKHGAPPQVLLASLGRPAQHGPRSQYSKSFFEAGGFLVIQDEAAGTIDAAVAALDKHQAPIAVLCSTDEIYAEQAATAAQRLKQAGAKTVVLAGVPGANEAAWREAGVDRFIFMKCDVLATLRELLAGLGVISA